ncbi:hypothetical protein pb186bvf_019395 [Paramecium bursaria]
MNSQQPFRVYVRIRGNTDTYNDRVKLINDKTLQLDVGSNDKNYSKTKKMTFNKIFNQQTNNQQVFDQTLKEFLPMLIQGFHVTLLCYGMTGAGKTHTMFGNNDGIIQNAIKELSQYKIQTKLSFMEIYNESLKDLLSNNQLIIQEDKYGDIQIPGITEICLKDEKDFIQLIKDGQQRRQFASTVNNIQSSRSHAIVLIKVNNYDEISKCNFEGKLTLVDLAGSEKSHYYDQANKRQYEGQNINRSLLTLGRCIIMLNNSNKIQHIPYRNSKLTRILKQSLGGNSITLLISCISLSKTTQDETENTLNYAFAATKIVSQIRQVSISKPINTDLSMSGSQNRSKSQPEQDKVLLENLIIQNCQIQKNLNDLYKSEIIDQVKLQVLEKQLQENIKQEKQYIKLPRNNSQMMISILCQDWMHIEKLNSPAHFKIHLLIDDYIYFFCILYFLFVYKFILIIQKPQLFYIIVLTQIKGLI